MFSCGFTEQLICNFVFAYAKCLFCHDAVQICRYGYQYRRLGFSNRVMLILDHNLETDFQLVGCCFLTLKELHLFFCHLVHSSSFPHQYENEFFYLCYKELGGN